MDYKLKVWIYGHHIHPQWLEFESFDDLVSKNVGGLPKLISSKHSWKVCNDIPTDDMKATVMPDFSTSGLDVQDLLKMVGSIGAVSKPLRTCGLTQFAHLKISLAKTRTSRCMLMNDEVAYQWSSGSYVAYRFETKSLARELWKRLVPTHFKDIKFAEKEFCWDVGDQVKLATDFDVGSFKYTKDDILRVYDINATSFVPAPIPEKTLCKIPGTKWSYDWIGYGWIPLSNATLARELK